MSFLINNKNIAKRIKKSLFQWKIPTGRQWLTKLSKPLLPSVLLCKETRSVSVLSSVNERLEFWEDEALESTPRSTVGPSVEKLRGGPQRTLKKKKREEPKERKGRNERHVRGWSYVYVEMFATLGRKTVPSRDSVWRVCDGCCFFLVHRRPHDFPKRCENGVKKSRPCNGLIFHPLQIICWMPYVGFQRRTCLRLSSLSPLYKPRSRLNSQRRIIFCKVTTGMSCPARTTYVHAWILWVFMGLEKKLHHQISDNNVIVCQRGCCWSGT